MYFKFVKRINKKIKTNSSRCSRLPKAAVWDNGPA
jgi:hypothetical protein